LRCFRILCDDQIMAEAYSVWALITLAEQKLLPVLAFPYQIEPDPALEGDLAARVRIPPLAQMSVVGERKIVYSDIDYNGHMNNTHYPDMLCDFVPDILRKRVTGMIVSYRHEAAFGHTLRVFGTKTEGGYLICTVDGDQTVCTEALLQLSDIPTQN
jgi:acyl-CoA thioesterase FadM